jgi:hypothetical protein
METASCLESVTAAISLRSLNIRANNARCEQTSFTHLAPKQTLSLMRLEIAAKKAEL